MNHIDEETRQKIQELRATIRTRVLHAAELRAAIRASKGRARYDAWNRKRSHGAYTRDALLALAFLRGIPYARVEPRTRHPVLPTDVAVAAGVEAAAVQAWLEPVPAAAAERAAA